MSSEEEFEFKPINQGLGFHKKAVDQSGFASARLDKPADLPKTFARPDAERISQIMSGLPDLDFLSDKKGASLLNTKVSPQIQKAQAPLLSRSPISHGSSGNLNAIAKAPAPVNPNQSVAAKGNPAPILTKTLPTSKKPDFKMPNQTFATATATASASVALPSMARNQTMVAPKTAVEPMVEGAQTASINIFALFFDVLVVLGLTCLFSVALLTITESNLSNVLSNAQEDLTTQVGILLLVLSVVNLYVIVSRSFTGSTLGEWTFDTQVGTSEQQQKAWYPLAVCWRAFLAMVTGYLPLTLLSMILRKDIMGILSGIRLRKV